MVSMLVSARWLAPYMCPPRGSCSLSNFQRSGATSRPCSYSRGRDYDLFGCQAHERGAFSNFVGCWFSAVGCCWAVFRNQVSSKPDNYLWLWLRSGDQEANGISVRRTEAKRSYAGLPLERSGAATHGVRVVPDSRGSASVLCR